MYHNKEERGGGEDKLEQRQFFFEFDQKRSRSNESRINRYLCTFIYSRCIERVLFSFHESVHRFPYLMAVSEASRKLTYSRYGGEKSMRESEQ